MLYTRVNLTRPGGTSPGSGNGREKVIIVAAEDVLVYPPRDANGVKHQGNFVMKAGAKMIEIYTTKSKGSAPVESDGDEDSISMKQMFETQHPGNRSEVKEFVQNFLGVNVFILHKPCNQEHYEVMGTPCAPLQLKPSKTENNDATFWALKFEAFAKSSLIPGDYYGEIVTAAPFNVVDATEFEITSDNGFQYKLPATSVATIADVSIYVVPDRSTITLIGSGGSVPTTLASGAGSFATIVLKEGSTWTALDGAVLHLQAYQAGSIYYLIELSRA